MTFEQEFGEQLAQVILYVQLSERLSAAVDTLAVTMNAIKAMIEVDRELGPELLAASQHVVEAGKALGRAQTFIGTRLDVILNPE